MRTERIMTAQETLYIYRMKGLARMYVRLCLAG